MIDALKSHKDFIMAALVFILLLYLIYDKGTQYLNEKERQTFQRGYSKAVSEVTRQIVLSTQGCKAVSISDGNRTVEVLTVECANSIRQQSYLKGVKDTVSKIISDGKSCKTVPVSDGTTQENFIAVSCLQT